MVVQSREGIPQVILSSVCLILSSDRDLTPQSLQKLKTLAKYFNKTKHRPMHLMACLLTLK